jgi:5-formyltetrahydrofolate cyclo-ligase
MENQHIKAEIRKAVLARRDRLDNAARVEMSLAAAEHGDAALEFAPGTIISGFLPIRSEIDARPLLYKLRARGAQLCLPIVMDRATIVFRAFDREDDLVETGFGTLGPGSHAYELEPDIMIIPLAAFDGTGNRIGYGAGYYDRAIDRLHAGNIYPGLVGMAFSVQEVDIVPTLQHDKPIDGIITETGYRHFMTDGT